MTRFRCVPIPTETADRFRSAGLDDRGNPIRRVAATADGGFPCRHCLRLGQPGESMLLGSYDLPEPRGIYWTPSPIFLHARDCPRAETVDELAPIVRANALVSIRAHVLLAGGLDVAFSSSRCAEPFDFAGTCPSPGWRGWHLSVSPAAR